MQILVIRHGHAVDDAPGLGDEARWLSGKGRKVTRRVAAWLAKRDERRPGAIWTSSLVRAVQTAEILAEAAGLTDEISVLGELAPESAPGDLVKRLAAYSGAQPLALVGHEPHLSSFTALLFGPGATDAELRLKKSGVISLTWDGQGPAMLRFLLDPKEMSVTTELPSADDRPRSSG